MSDDLTALPIVAVDWAIHGIHVTFDGVEVERFSSVRELLDSLQTEHRIVAESTIESWDPERRLELARRVEADGHVLLLFRPLQTARLRVQLGLTKTHDADARVIHRIAIEGRVHLYPILARDVEWIDFRAKVNRDYQRLRLSGEKSDLADEAKRVLGPYRHLPPDEQAVLGNGQKYRETALAATYFAALNARSRAEFERLLGLHGSGYPTLLRSEVHHHGLRHARKRDVSPSEFRRILRRVFAQIKQQRPPPPTR